MQVRGTLTEKFRTSLKNSDEGGGRAHHWISTKIYMPLSVAVWRPTAARASGSEGMEGRGRRGGRARGRGNGRVAAAGMGERRRGGQARGEGMERRQRAWASDGGDGRGTLARVATSRRVERSGRLFFFRSQTGTASGDFGMAFACNYV